MRRKRGFTANRRVDAKRHKRHRVSAQAIPHRYHPLVAVDDQLRIDTRIEPDRVILELRGELDLVGAPLLQSAIETDETKSREILVLDLVDLRFMDSTGLRAILAAQERSQGRGQNFALTRGSQQVERLLAIAGVSEHLPVIASPDAALVSGGD